MNENTNLKDMREYTTEVLAYSPGTTWKDSSGLYWQKDRGQDGLAWRVIGPKGNELAIYDDPTVAHDARNNLNIPSMTYEQFHAAQ
jgi:hypothetical protein